MRRVYLALGLLMLLTAQQGAVLHELSHLYGVTRAEISVEADRLADNTCGLCIAYAQLANPASNPLPISHVTPAASTLGPEPAYSVTAAEVPKSRSRGPPALS